MSLHARYRFKVLASVTTILVTLAGCGGGSSGEVAVVNPPAVEQPPVVEKPTEVLITSKVVSEVAEGSFNNRILQLLQQADGKLVGVSQFSAYGTSYNSVVFRYSGDGSFDSSFGSAGKILIDSSFSTTSTPSSGISYQLNTIAQDGFGGFVVAGTSSNNSFSIINIDRFGRLVDSFGRNGLLMINPGSSAEFGYPVSGAQSLLVTDETILVGGFSSQRCATSLCAKYSTIIGLDKFGGLIPNFANSGVLIDDKTSSISKILPHDGGSFIVAGELSSSGRNLPFISRYLSSGAIDTSFGDGGITFINRDITNATIGIDAVRLPNGTTVVLAGERLQKFDPQGRVISDFGENGVRTLSSIDPMAIGSNGIFGPLLALQGEDKIILVGGNKVYRLTINGDLDLSFGADGVATLDLSYDAQNQQTTKITTVLVQRDGKIVYGGSELGKLVMLRSLVDGSSDPTFGSL